MTCLDNARCISVRVELSTRVAESISAPSGGMGAMSDHDSTLVGDDNSTLVGRKTVSSTGDRTLVGAGRQTDDTLYQQGNAVTPNAINGPPSMGMPMMRPPMMRPPMMAGFPPGQALRPPPPMNSPGRPINR